MADPPSRRSPQAGADQLATRVLGTGVRAGQRLAGATGVDSAVDAAVEEAIVGAMESPAVERALIRLAEDGRLQGVIEQAVATADVEDLVGRAIESDAADRIWAEILASDKAQMLVERVAEAPEVRAAIAQQGFGLISDIGLQVRRLTRPLDRVVERLPRALTGREKRAGKTPYAGFVTRLLAGAIDLALLAGGFSLAYGLLASIWTGIFGQSDGLSTIGLVVVAVVGAVTAANIVTSFWALAGQTPGMRFLGIRLDAGGERRIGGRRAWRRLIALPFSALVAGVGFLWILFDDDRRGWQDKFAGTTVQYDDSMLDAPYAKGAAGEGQAP